MEADSCGVGELSNELLPDDVSQRLLYCRAWVERYTGRFVSIRVIVCTKRRSSNKTNAYINNSYTSEVSAALKLRKELGRLGACKFLAQLLLIAGQRLKSRSPWSGSCTKRQDERTGVQ